MQHARLHFGPSVPRLRWRRFSISAHNPRIGQERIKIFRIATSIKNVLGLSECIPPGKKSAAANIPGNNKKAAASAYGKLAIRPAKTVRPSAAATDSKYLRRHSFMVTSIELIFMDTFIRRDRPGRNLGLHRFLRSWTDSEDTRFPMRQTPTRTRRMVYIVG